MKILNLFGLLLISNIIFAQCRPLGVTATTSNCGVGQSPQITISLQLCASGTAGNWNISYPGGTNNIGFYAQETCPNSFNCGTASSTINMPFGFNCTAFNINNLIITSPNGTTCPYASGTTTCSLVLPLKISNISVSADNLTGSHIIEWAMADNSKFQNIEILASNDGIDFQTISKKDYQINTNYNFTNSNVNYPKMFYKLLINKLDNSKLYSSIVNVSSKIKPEISVWPNPASNTLNVNLGKNMNSIKTVFSIIDINGKLYKTTKFNVIDISSLKTGIYILQSNDGISIQRTKFIKN
jgi:hypothetical protein